MSVANPSRSVHGPDAAAHTSKPLWTPETKKKKWGVRGGSLDSPLQDSYIHQAVCTC